VEKKRDVSLGEKLRRRGKKRRRGKRRGRGRS
jgi:hypothetical protein